MMKNKLDFKLLNCAIVMVIIFLIYKTSDLWIGVLTKVGSLIFPFILAFVIAYVLYPILKFLQKNKIPKFLAVTLILFSVIAILTVFGIIIGPLLFNQLGSLFNSIMDFVKELNGKLNLSGFEKALSNSFDDIIGEMGKYVSNGAVNIIGGSLSVLSTFFISFAASIYFLVDMENIRKKVKKLLCKRSKKIFNYVRLLDREMINYLSGFVRIMLISLVEYSLAYTIIGHPNAILLGCLAVFAQLIPYFGGMVNNVIAAITAFVISPALFIRTVIVFLVLSTVDGYVINPLVYGKSNKIHPLLVIISVFIGGALFGIMGIIISLPTAIIIVTTYRYFEEDLKDKIEDIREDFRN